MLWLVYFQLLCFCSGIWLPRYVVDRPKISDVVLWGITVEYERTLVKQNGHMTKM